MTIGPASSERATLEALVDAGANAMRLNFSHGKHEDHAERCRAVREIEAASGWRTLALIADLQGPKLRITELPEPMTVSKDEHVLVAGADGARDGAIPVAPSVVGDVLQPGHEILIDDGHIRLRVDKVERGQVRAGFAQRSQSVAEKYRTVLADWYGKDRAAKVQYAEAFEICEYGRRPNREELAKLFPFFEP